MTGNLWCNFLVMLILVWVRKENCEARDCTLSWWVEDQYGDKTSIIGYLDGVRITCTCKTQGHLVLEIEKTGSFVSLKNSTRPTKEIAMTLRREEVGMHVGQNFRCRHMNNRNLNSGSQNLISFQLCKPSRWSGCKGTHPVCYSDSNPGKYECKEQMSKDICDYDQLKPAAETGFNATCMKSTDEPTAYSLCEAYRRTSLKNNEVILAEVENDTLCNVNSNFQKAMQNMQLVRVPNTGYTRDDLDLHYSLGSTYLADEPLQIKFKNSYQCRDLNPKCAYTYLEPTFSGVKKRSLELKGNCTAGFTFNLSSVTMVDGGNTGISVDKVKIKCSGTVKNGSSRYNFLFYFFAVKSGIKVECDGQNVVCKQYRSTRNKTTPATVKETNNGMDYVTCEKIAAYWEKPHVSFPHLSSGLTKENVKNIHFQKPNCGEGSMGKDDNRNNKSNGLNAGAIAGIAIGVLILLLIVIVVIAVVIRIVQQRKEDKNGSREKRDMRDAKWLWYNTKYRRAESGGR